jgi:hypothetical protein
MCFLTFRSNIGLYLQVTAEIVGKKGVRELCGNVGRNKATQTGREGGGAVGMSQWKYFTRSAVLRVNSEKNAGR